MMYKEPKTFTITDVVNFIDRAHGASRKEINRLKNEAICINHIRIENPKEHLTEKLKT